jgi:hypothetical protein
VEEQPIKVRTYAVRLIFERCDLLMWKKMRPWDAILKIDLVTTPVAIISFALFFISMVYSIISGESICLIFLVFMIIIFIPSSVGLTSLIQRMFRYHGGIVKKYDYSKTASVESIIKNLDRNIRIKRDLHTYGSIGQRFGLNSLKIEDDWEKVLLIYVYKNQEMKIFLSKGSKDYNVMIDRIIETTELDSYSIGFSV